MKLWTPCAVVAALTLGAAGCAPADFATDDPAERYEASPAATCEPFVERLEGIGDLREATLRKALTQVPALEPVGEAYRTEHDEGADDEVTVFAPVEGLEIGDRGPEQDAELRDAGGDSLRAAEFVATHVVEDAVLRAEDLLEAGAVELADASTLEARWTDDDELLVSRLGIDVEVVCADIETLDGIIHVIDAPLATQEQVRGDDDQDGEPSQQPRSRGDEPGERGLPEDVDEELDELQDRGGEY